MKLFPFYNQPHDHILALDICRGLRPPIRMETPKFLKELIEKCWDANPENRPTSGKIFDTLYSSKNMPSSNNFNELTNSSLTSEAHPQAIYTSRPFSFPNLPVPVNCPNQHEFVSSRNYIKIQTGEFIYMYL